MKPLITTALFTLLLAFTGMGQTADQITPGLAANNAKVQELTAQLEAIQAQLQAAASAPTFPSIPLPAGIALFGAFNQLGSPRFTGGFSAIYPYPGSTSESLHLYGTTTADFYPKKSIDPATGRQFYAITATGRQGIHRDMLDTGRWSFLLGFDLGPSFSQAQPSGINVNLSTSFAVTPLCQISRVFSAIVPIRMLYVSGIGWNPVVEAGVVINLKNLPKRKAVQ
jgi:hypothetical protein